MLQSDDWKLLLTS